MKKAAPESFICKQNEEEENSQQLVSSSEFIYLDDDSNDSLIDQKIDLYRQEKHGSDLKDGSGNINEQVNKISNTDCDVKIDLDFKQNQWKTGEDNELKVNVLRQLQDLQISTCNEFINNGNVQKKEEVESNFSIPSSNNTKSRNSNGIGGQMANLDTITRHTRGSMNSYERKYNLEDKLFDKENLESLDRSLCCGDDIWQKQLKFNSNVVKRSQLRASTRNPLDITQREQQILQKKKNNQQNIQKQLQYQQQQLSPVRFRKQSSGDYTSSNDYGLQSPSFNSFSPCKRQTNENIKSEFISPQISISVQPYIQSHPQKRFLESLQTLDNIQQLPQRTKLNQSPNRSNININKNFQTNHHSPLSHSSLSTRQQTIPTPQSNKSAATKQLCFQVHPSPLRSIISLKHRNANKQLILNPAIYISNLSGNTFIQHKQDTKSLQKEQDQVDYSSLPTAEDRSRRSSRTCHKIGYSCGILSQNSDSHQFSKGFLCSTESTKNYSTHQPVQTHHIFQGNQAFQICPSRHNKHNSNQQSVLRSNLNDSSFTTPKSTSLYKNPSKNCSIFSNGIFSICENNHASKSFMEPSPKQKNNSNSSRTKQSRQFSNEFNQGKLKLKNLFTKNQCQPIAYRSKSQLSNSSDNRQTTISPVKRSRTPKNLLINSNYIYFPQQSTLSPKLLQPMQFQDDQYSAHSILPQIPQLNYLKEDLICMPPPRSISHSRVSNRTSRYHDNQQHITVSSSRTLEPRQLNYTQNTLTINKWSYTQNNKKTEKSRSQSNQNKISRQQFDQSFVVGKRKVT